MNLLVSGAALLFACAGFLAYDLYTFREALVRGLAAQAEIVGTNSIGAVTFNDPESAEKSLSALAKLPNILSAGILTVDGRDFAEYIRPGSSRVISLPTPESNRETHYFGRDEITLVHPITFQGKVVFFVYIRSDLAAISNRLRQYIAIALIVLLISLGAGTLVSGTLKRALAEPIIKLANTAQEIERIQDFSVRAQSTGDHDEVDLLIESFNSMLAKIQQRDDALGVAREHLEQKVQERTNQLAISNQELRAFSYSVSHDLRGPLEVINGFSYVLATEYAEKLDANGRECLQQVRNATMRMAELIEDLLKLSQVSTSLIQTDNVDLSTIARSIAANLQRREPQRRVEFLIPDTPKVRGDERLLRIALENLLNNSWKYTSHHASARIEFGSELRQGESVFYVRDDGAGFNPSQSQRLFKPFQRLHTNSEFTGNGIGLATVQRIIQRHAGEVWATGGIEQGASFFFTLGTQSNAANFSQASVGTSSPGGGSPRTSQPAS